LVPTIRDCIKQSDYPDGLFFCIAWQHDSNESLQEFANHPHVKVIDIDYRASQGACWARNKIQQMYGGQDYTLQLDSHHRFVKGWDSKCMVMMNQLIHKGIKKPLLTAYLPSFETANDPKMRVNQPWKMCFDRFTPEGVVFFKPETIENYKTLTTPIPAHFYSAHFCFTLGQFCKDVQHDPNYYFHGEEISITVRSFTNGYDLFHPHQVIAWHEYTRQGRTKHWDDHDSSWATLNTKCHKRNRCLFSMDGEKYGSIKWGIYGFGRVKTLQDYERYSGICFATKSKSIPLHEKYINIPLRCFPYRDYDLWSVSFETAQREVVYKKDYNKQECEAMIKSNMVTIVAKFNSIKAPNRVVITSHRRKEVDRIIQYL
jgi:hypothetical protein